MFHPLRFQQQMWCVSCRGKEQEREKDGKSSRQRSLRQEIHRHALEEYRCRFADALSSELVQLVSVSGKKILHVFKLQIAGLVMLARERKFSFIDISAFLTAGH
jgi:hypothetical protein